MAKSLDINQLTLRDKIREAARKSHDLIEHLEHSFVPKVHDLRKLARPQEPKSETPPVQDVTIRHQAALVMESDDYTERLCTETDALFESIATEVHKLATRGQSRMPGNR